MVQLSFIDRKLEIGARPLIMGIINVNDDSFSADGSLDRDEVCRMIREKLDQGADIIDVGAESARTNRKAITVEEELRRFAMILKSWEYCWAEINPRDSMQVWPPILSANTWRPEVVQGVLPMGVEWINDMSGLPDGKNAEHCADAGAALLIMHSVGEPKVPHFHQQWPDVIGSVKNFFAEKIELAEHCGLSREHLILDPGIDFAKQKDDNLLIYRNLEELTMLDRPLLVPVSRKTVIGDVLGIANPNERDAATVACMTWCMRRGGSIFRVHNVKAAYETARCFYPIGE